VNGSSVTYHPVASVSSIAPQRAVEPAVRAVPKPSAQKRSRAR
jgi:hypothetical protein